MHICTALVLASLRMESKTALGLRHARRWSRERLAAEAGVSLATVWRVENGHYPRVEHLIALADALGVSVDQLLGRAAAVGRQRSDPRE